MGRYVIDNRRAEIDFEHAQDMTARTLQNAKNLLMLRSGEIPYDRLRGVDAEMAGMPIARVRERIAQELDRVLLWEPDATLVDAQASLDEQGNLLITATIDISV
ncbi:MAG: hypothetical protein ACI4PG_03800 [Candidatus Ventricola sp.]